MRWLNPTTAVLITAVLALLLVGYVFGVGDPDREERTASSAARDAAARCSSREASELLKRELFARAAALRGRDGAAMAQAARFSAVRVASATATDVDEGSEEVTCRSSLVVDLPPEMAVVGGRRSLAGTAEYRLQAGENGQAQLRLLSNPQAIVTPLAALTPAQRQAPATYDVTTAEANASGPEPAGPAVAPPPPPVPHAEPPPPPPVQRRAAPPPAPRSQTATRQPTRPPERKATAEREPPPPERREVAAAKPARPPEPRAIPAPPPPRQVAAVRPSFDCRRARARSEVAVCGDPGLASLDRQMSGRFFSALRVARPGQRALLQRSRNRFLAYRNACPSSSCIAQAYRDRIREIDAIMTGGY